MQGDEEDRASERMIFRGAIGLVFGIQIVGIAVTAYQVHMGRKEPADLIVHIVIFFLVFAIAWGRIRDRW